MNPIQLMAACSILLLFISRSASPADGPIIAIFDIEDKGAGIKPPVLNRLTDYLAVLLTEGGYQIIPRDQIRARLHDQKKAAFSGCFDQGCQVDLGRELAAQKTLASQIMKIGGNCRVASTVYDLKKATAERAASVKSECTEDALGLAIEELAHKLQGQNKGIVGFSGEKRRASLSRGEILSTMKKHSIKINECIRKQIEVNPRLEGKIDISFTILPNGTISTVYTTSPPFKKSFAENCIGEVIRQMQFPEFSGIPTTISFPFRVGNQD